MTKRVATRMVTAAAKKRRKQTAAKEAPVSPQIEELHIPDGLVLQQRDVCHQRADERPMLRDKDGNVRAVVEAWRPDFASN